MPYGLPAMLCTWRRNGFSTFYVINLTDNLGGTWTPTVLQFRTGTLETCILTACCLLREAALDLLVPVGLLLA